MRLFSFQTQTRIASWRSAFGRRERTQSVISGSSTTAFAKLCSPYSRANRLSVRSRSIPRPATRSPQAKPPDNEPAPSKRRTSNGAPFPLKIPRKIRDSDLLKNPRPRQAKSVTRLGKFNEYVLLRLSLHKPSSSGLTGIRSGLVASLRVPPAFTQDEAFTRDSRSTAS